MLGQGMLGQGMPCPNIFFPEALQIFFEFKPRVQLWEPSKFPIFSTLKILTLSTIYDL